MHWNTDHRHRENRCAHARKVCRHPGSCDNDLEALRLCGLRILKENIRLPVCGNNCHLILDPESFQHLCGFAHHRHVRITAHHNSYFCHRTFSFFCCSSYSKTELILLTMLPLVNASGNYFPASSNDSLSASVPGTTNLPPEMTGIRLPSARMTSILPSSSYGIVMSV